MPRQKPSRLTLSRRRVPSAPMPMLVRSGRGGCSRTPFRTSTPLGWPSPKLKRSPFTPATVAVPLRRLCMSVTFSRKMSDSFESTGCSEYSPPGLGEVITFRTTGPWGVNWTRFVYVTSGISNEDVEPCASACAGKNAPSSSKMKSLRSTARIQGSFLPWTSSFFTRVSATHVSGSPCARCSRRNIASRRPSCGRRDRSSTSCSTRSPARARRSSALRSGEAARGGRGAAGTARPRVCDGAPRIRASAAGQRPVRARRRARSDPVHPRRARLARRRACVKAVPERAPRGDRGRRTPAGPGAARRGRSARARVHRVTTRTTLVEGLMERFPDVPREAVLKEDLLRAGIAFDESALTDNLDGDVKPKSYFIFSFDQKPLAQLGEAAKRRPPEEIALTGGPYQLRRTIVSVRVNPDSPYRAFGGEAAELRLELEGNAIADIGLPPMPEYYRHTLANGKSVMETAPTIQWGYLIYLTVLRLCQYFGAKEECGFCDINHNWRQHRQAGRPYTGVRPVDDVLEALELIDRYDSDKASKAYTLTGGSITSTVDGLAEADFYGRYAQAIEERFPKRWIGKLVAQALPKDDA